MSDKDDVAGIIRRGDERDRDAHNVAGGASCALYALAFLMVSAGILCLSLAVGR